MFCIKVFFDEEVILLLIFLVFYILDYQQCFIRVKFDMLSKLEFSIKDESKISPIVFWAENRSPKTAEIERRRVGISMQSTQVKNFRFPIF